MEVTSPLSGEVQLLPAACAHPSHLCGKHFTSIGCACLLLCSGGRSGSPMKSACHRGLSTTGSALTMPWQYITCAHTLQLLITGLSGIHDIEIQELRLGPSSGLKQTALAIPQLDTSHQQQRCCVRQQSEGELSHAVQDKHTCSTAALAVLRTLTNGALCTQNWCSGVAANSERKKRRWRWRGQRSRP